MKVAFYGFDTVLECPPGQTTVFEIESKPLFSGVCQSLISEMKDQALEPYILWDDSGEPLKSADNPIIIVNPFDLPWGNRRITGVLYDRLERILTEDDSMRSTIESLGAQLSSHILGLSLQLEGNYGFGLEWEMPKYLKAFGFVPDYSETDRLIDNLESFLAVAADVELKQALVFINLRKFLSSEELSRFEVSVKKSNMSVLLLESCSPGSEYDSENVHGIDLQLLEY